jgi:hypothetical protein
LGEATAGADPEELIDPHGRADGPSGKSVTLAGADPGARSFQVEAGVFPSFT